MLVKELRGAYDTNGEKQIHSLLSDVELTGDGLVLKKADKTLLFDEDATDHVAKYLGINAKYLEKCPPELQIVNVNHWLKKWGETEASFHTMGDTLRGVHNPNKKIVPVGRVLDLAERVFGPEDDVKRFQMSDKLLHMDIIDKDLLIEVPGTGTDDRPKVGDVTYGGLRFFVYPNREQVPVVQYYANRLICTNGQSMPSVEQQIKLRGNTVSEVLAELEEKAKYLLEDMPTKLEEYAKTAEMEIPGNRAEFAYQIGRERGLPQKVMDRVMDLMATLPEGATVYDVLQIFTSIANGNVTYSTELRLQRIGGSLGWNTSEMLHRCEQCERPI